MKNLTEGFGVFDPVEREVNFFGSIEQAQAFVKKLKGDYCSKDDGVNDELFEESIIIFKTLQFSRLKKADSAENYRFKNYKEAEESGEVFTDDDVWQYSDWDALYDFEMVDFKHKGR